MSHPANISTPPPPVHPEAIQHRSAHDPATAPAELRRLFDIRQTMGRNLKKALAGNPSTPLDLLVQLAEEVPSAFCRNPIAPLVSLEMPDFFQRVSAVGIARMLRSPHTPLPIVEQIAAGDCSCAYLMQTARMHLQTRGPIPPGAWLEEVRNLLWSSVHAITDDGGKQTVAELADLGVVPKKMAAVVGVEDVPEPEDFPTLIKRFSHREASELEEGYKRKFDRYQPISSLPNIFLAIGASYNPDIAPEIKSRWADESPLLAEALARNPETPDTVLTKLSYYSQSHIRRMVLKNHSCPPEVILARRQIVSERVLHEDVGGFLRWEHYYNNYREHNPLPKFFARFFTLMNAPDSVRNAHLTDFAESAVWEDRLAVVFAVAKRPNGKPAIPKHRVLPEQLANDGISLVRAAAQARLRGEVFSLEEP